jgi:hypothetical protein
MVSYIVPKECVVLRPCCANLELSWFYHIAVVRSLFLVLNLQPVCPLYSLLQVLRFSSYNPNLLSSVFCCYNVKWFLIVLFVWKAILM